MAVAVAELSSSPRRIHPWWSQVEVEGPVYMALMKETQTRAPRETAVSRLAVRVGLMGVEGLSHLTPPTRMHKEQEGQVSLGMVNQMISEETTRPLAVPVLPMVVREEAEANGQAEIPVTTEASAAGGKRARVAAVGVDTVEEAGEVSAALYLPLLKTMVTLAVAAVPTLPVALQIRR